MKGAFPSPASSSPHQKGRGAEGEKFPKTRAFLWKNRLVARPGGGGRFSGAALLLLDQRVLPHRVVWKTCLTWSQVSKGITDMVVRGAPAIGCVAAYGMVLASRAKNFSSIAEQKKYLEHAFDGLLQARPTAINLRWALERMRQMYTRSPATGGNEVLTLAQQLEKEAIKIEEEDRQSNRRIGRYGAAMLPFDSVVLTHCNTGSLATAGLGTAFGVLWTAHQDNKIHKVIACETRPYLQGARLTAWELQQEKIPFELITDSMAAHFMKTEKINAVIVGADRIAANGDTANKIGTYSLAVLAAYHDIPFYVAAPCSTIDLATATGRDIPIEERPAGEVTRVSGKSIAPTDTVARHPAFDITPEDLIASIITDKGVMKPPYSASLRNLFESRPVLI